MLAKRIVPCLDIKDGKTVKGINFVNFRDAAPRQRVHHAAEGHLPDHRHRRQGNGLRRSCHLRPNLRADVPPHRHRLYLSAAGHGIQLAAKFTGKEAASK